MKSLLLIFLLAPFLSLAHPIHVSVCEMTHNAETDLLEITIKIFADDFNDVLADRTGKTILLGQEGEHKNIDSFIKDYLDEKLILEINGKPVALEFDKKEVEDVATWCYLHVSDIKEINTLSIQNSVMIHWFKDQVNVVHVDCNDKMNSTFFSKGKEVDVFNFQ